MPTYLIFLMSHPNTPFALTDLCSQSKQIQWVGTTRFETKLFPYSNQIIAGVNSTLELAIPPKTKVEDQSSKL